MKAATINTKQLEEKCRVATFLGLGVGDAGATVIFEDSLLELSLDDSQFSNPVYCNGTFYGMMNE